MNKFPCDGYDYYKMTENVLCYEEDPCGSCESKNYYNLNLVIH